jgi:hypothetical protein
MPHHVEIPAVLGGLIEVREDAPNGFARILAFPLLLWRLWRPRNVGSDFGHVRYPASSQARTIVTCSKSCRLSVLYASPLVGAEKQGALRRLCFSSRPTSSRQGEGAMPDFRQDDKTHLFAHAVACHSTAPEPRQPCLDGLELDATCRPATITKYRGERFRI